MGKSASPCAGCLLTILQYDPLFAGLLRDIPRKRAHRKNAVDQRKVAVLDMETDPFDAARKSSVYPFLAVLYSKEFQYVIWEDDWKKLVSRVIDLINDLPEPYIIYAHNGGRFDFMFLIHELRGTVVFKGRSLMSAEIGQHELRDSFHIMPEKLKNVGGKDDISYELMLRKNRNKKRNRENIITYCIADCRYLYDSVMAFRARFGSPLTIGQAAIKELRKTYNVDNLSEKTDDFLRGWFFGGRVECFRLGMLRGNFSLFDVNSMYPYVMARRLHPVGNEIFINNKVRAGKTAFLTIRCRNNGALVARDTDGSLTTRIQTGVFNTTIHEFETAIRHGLIEDWEIIRTIEFRRFCDFANFVEPIYNERANKKQEYDTAVAAGNDIVAKQLKYEVLFAKLLLNNAYGKFAQNPRRFKKHLITGPEEMPEDEGWGYLPEVETDEYRIWSKPNPEFRFNNVATAASITGAARSVLLDAIATANNPIYCDTDSLVCNNLGDDIVMDRFALGAWDREAAISTFIGNGKKLYAYEKTPSGERVVKAKGMNGVSWEDMVSLANGQVMDKTMMAPTIRKDGSQVYITRTLQRTAI